MNAFAVFNPVSAGNLHQGELENQVFPRQGMIGIKSHLVSRDIRDHDLNQHAVVPFELQNLSNGRGKVFRKLFAVEDATMSSRRAISLLAGNFTDFLLPEPFRLRHPQTRDDTPFTDCKSRGSPLRRIEDLAVFEGSL